MDPFGVTEEDACRLMGCTPTMLENWRRKKIVVPVCRGVYSVNQLASAMRKLEELALAKARIEDNTIDLESR